MKKQVKRLYITAITILFSVYLVNAQSPPLEGTWAAIPELTDEFDEGIDTDKWYTKDPEWLGRFPSYFEPNNISVDGGLLKLKCREVTDQDDLPFTTEGVYTYATAAYKNKNLVKYGYFEVKAKASDSKYWNSFWFYDVTDTDWTEIDVYEIVASENYLVRTAHLFYSADYQGTIGDHTKSQQEIGPWIQGWPHYDGFFAEYHVYGLDWNKDSITWYVDDEAVFTAENKYWHQPLYLIFDAEVNPVWPSLPSSTEVIYEVDYVRAWKKTSTSSITNSLNLCESIVYPNPGTGEGKLNYSSPYTGDVSIKVLTIDGKQINEFQLQKNDNDFEHQIDLSSQASGVYFVQFAAGEYRSVHQIIKN